MILVIALSLVGVLALAALVLVGLEPGVAPADVAVAYELAWDRLDFVTLWDLSGVELRDGRTRADFLAEKHRAYGDRRDLSGVVDHVAVDSIVQGSRDALVDTCLALTDGSTVHDQVRLERRRQGWQVVGYRLAV